MSVHDRPPTLPSAAILTPDNKLTAVWNALRLSEADKRSLSQWVLQSLFDGRQSTFETDLKRCTAVLVLCAQARCSFWRGTIGATQNHIVACEGCATNETGARAAALTVEHVDRRRSSARTRARPLHSSACSPFLTSGNGRRNPQGISRLYTTAAAIFQPTMRMYVVVGRVSARCRLPFSLQQCIQVALSYSNSRGTTATAQRAVGKRKQKKRDRW